jgi:hypothetical protein
MGPAVHPLLLDAARLCRHYPGDRWFVDETVDELQRRAVPPRGHKVRALGYGEHAFVERVRTLAAESGQHGKPFAELEADGLARHWQENVFAVELDGVFWTRKVQVQRPGGDQERGDKTRQRNEAAHLRAECALRDHTTLDRWLTQQPNGRLRINTEKVKTEASMDGKYLIATSDPTISAEDVAWATRTSWKPNAASAT